MGPRDTERKTTHPGVQGNRTLEKGCGKLIPVRTLKTEASWTGPKKGTALESRQAAKRSCIK